VDASQQPFLDFLRNTAQSSFGGFNQAQQGFASQLQGFGQQATQQQANPFIGQLMQTAQGNPGLLAAQSDDLTSRVQNFTNQNIAGLNRGSIGGYGLGGGRNQVARGTAIGQGAEALTSGLLGLQDQAQNARLQAGGVGGGLFGQQQALQQQGLGLGGQFAGQAFASQFQPLSALQQFFGAPTVLSEQQSSSKSRGTSQSFGFAPFG
jgi:hypothetical protein